VTQANLITKFNASIVLDVRRARDTWCVYEHQVVMQPGEPPETIFIGACRVIDVYDMVDARSNSEWQNIFANGGQVLINIIGTTLNRVDAMRTASEMTKTAPVIPRCNLLGHNLRSQRRPILCLNNNVRYETQLHASADLGIHASSISRHMRGQASHAQGYKFIYAVDRKDEA
jgi:hypothetical protein